jgi:hypothetical protein
MTITWFPPVLPESSIVTLIVNVCCALDSPVMDVTAYANVCVALAASVAMTASVAVTATATQSKFTVRVNTTIPLIARADSKASVDPLLDRNIRRIAHAWLAFGTVTVKTGVVVLSAIAVTFF